MKIQSKFTNLALLFLSILLMAQEATDSMEIPGEKMVMENQGYREEIYPLIFMIILIIVLILFFLLMRNNGKNKRDNYRKIFKKS